jgi:hypothetical protein
MTWRYVLELNEKQNEFPEPGGNIPAKAGIQKAILFSNTGFLPSQECNMNHYLNSSASSLEIDLNYQTSAFKADISLN